MFFLYYYRFNSCRLLLWLMPWPCELVKTLDWLKLRVNNDTVNLFFIIYTIYIITFPWNFGVFKLCFSNHSTVVHVQSYLHSSTHAQFINQQPRLCLWAASTLNKKASKIKTKTIIYMLDRYSAKGLPKKLISIFYVSTVC